MPNNAAVAELSHAASQYQSSIVLQLDKKYIDVKSILGLYTTLVSSASYELHVHGPDAEAAKQELTAIFAKHGLAVTLAED